MLWPLESEEPPDNGQKLARVQQNRNPKSGNFSNSGRTCERTRNAKVTLQDCLTYALPMTSHQRFLEVLVFCKWIFLSLLVGMPVPI